MLDLVRASKDVHGQVAVDVPSSQASSNLGRSKAKKPSKPKKGSSVPTDLLSLEAIAQYEEQLQNLPPPAPPTAQFSNHCVTFCLM